MPQGIPRGLVVLPNGLRVLREGEHKDGCFVKKRALEAGTFPAHQWCRAYPSVGEPAEEHRNYNGVRRENGRYTWLRYVCNDGRCPARLLIRSDSLLRAAGVPFQ